MQHAYQKTTVRQLSLTHLIKKLTKITRNREIGTVLYRQQSEHTRNTLFLNLGQINFAIVAFCGHGASYKQTSLNYLYYQFCANFTNFRIVSYRRTTGLILYSFCLVRLYVIQSDRL